MNPSLIAARKVLGVKCTATKTDIRKAFINKAVIIHPDRCFGLSISSKRRRELWEKWFNLVKSYRLLLKHDSPFQKSKYKQGHHSSKACKLALQVRERK